MKSKKDNKLVLDKYTQPIYVPNTVYVAKNYTKEDITSRFKYSDGIDLEINDGFDATTYSIVKDKDNNSCILILLDKAVFTNKEPFYLEGVAAHEALHAAHRILEYVGCDLHHESCENYAYMIEWITKCILKTAKK